MVWMFEGLWLLLHVAGVLIICSIQVACNWALKGKQLNDRQAYVPEVHAGNRLRPQAPAKIP